MGIFTSGRDFGKKDKAVIKNIINKLKTQKTNLPDGSYLTLKIRPKFGNKTKITLTLSKKIEDVDLSLLIDGQPIRVCQQGLHYEGPDGNDYASIEFKATKNF